MEVVREPDGLFSIIITIIITFITMRTRTLDMHVVARYAAGGAVALMLVAGLFMPMRAAHAASVDELRAKLTSLLEEMTKLQNSTGSSRNIGACEVRFSRNLTIGDRGSDVRALQVFLNSDSGTRLQGTYGIRGNETDYYGSVTANAVTKFQEKYRSSILTPVGLSRGNGFFGPSTRAYANLLCDRGYGADDSDKDTKDDDTAASRQDARDAISDAGDAIDKLEDAIDAASSSDARDDAKDELERAQQTLDEAEDAYDDKDFDEAVELAEEAEDIAEEALDELKDYEDNKDDEDEEYSYGISDIKSVVKSNLCTDGVCTEGSEYTITLKDGTVHTVTAQGYMTQSSFEKLVRDTGYTGSISAFEDMVEEEKQNQEYGVKQILRIYQVHDLTKKSYFYQIWVEGRDKITTSNVAETATTAQHVLIIRATGYTGTVDDLFGIMQYVNQTS